MSLPFGKREVKFGLSPAGAKTNELSAKHVRTRGFVTTGQYITPTVVGRPYLIRSPHFIPEFVFYTQSVMPKLSFFAEHKFLPELPKSNGAFSKKNHTSNISIYINLYRALLVGAYARRRR